MRYIYNVSQIKTLQNIPSASAAVIRVLGSLANIFLIKSFALSDIEGQGEDSRSNCPSSTASNIVFSVSKTTYQIYIVPVCNISFLNILQIEYDDNNNNKL